MFLMTFYYMSKCPIFYGKLIHKMVRFYLDTQYLFCKIGSIYIHKISIAWATTGYIYKFYAYFFININFTPHSQPCIITVQFSKNISEK